GHHSLEEMIHGPAGGRTHRESNIPTQTTRKGPRTIRVLPRTDFGDDTRGLRGDGLLRPAVSGGISSFFRRLARECRDSKRIRAGPASRHVFSHRGCSHLCSGNDWSACGKFHSRFADLSPRIPSAQVGPPEPDSRTIAPENPGFLDAVVETVVPRWCRGTGRVENARCFLGATDHASCLFERRISFDHPLSHTSHFSMYHGNCRNFGHWGFLPSALAL